MKTGYVIRLLRTTEGISQAELAGILGVTSSYLSQVENGHREPSLSFLKAVSERLRVPLVLLVGGEGDSDYERQILAELQRVLGDLVSARAVARHENTKRQETAAEKTDDSEYS